MFNDKENLFEEVLNEKTKIENTITSSESNDNNYISTNKAIEKLESQDENNGVTVKDETVNEVSEELETQDENGTVNDEVEELDTQGENNAVKAEVSVSDLNEDVSYESESFVAVEENNEIEAQDENKTADKESEDIETQDEDKAAAVEDETVNEKNTEFETLELNEIEDIEDIINDPALHNEAKAVMESISLDNEEPNERQQEVLESNDDDFQNLVQSVLSNTEDDNHAVNSNDGMPVMPLSIYQMLSSAKQIRTLLTGTITGARMTSRGLAVEVTTFVERYPLIVYIPLSKMGFDANVKDLVNQRVKRRCMGVTSVKTIEKVMNREYYTIITSMLGATVDYLVEDVIRDLNTVVGDRDSAIKVRKLRYLPSKTYPVPTIRVGTRYKARVLISAPKSLLVEVSGYTCILHPKDISSTSINIKSEYRAGSTIDVEITEFDRQKGVKVVAVEAKDKSLRANLSAHYKSGDRLLAEVIDIKPNTGEYFLRLPNGAFGKVPYYVGNDYKNIHKGTKVYVAVTGKSSKQSLVMCRIRKILY